VLARLSVIVDLLHSGHRACLTNRTGTPKCRRRGDSPNPAAAPTTNPTNLRNPDSRVDTPVETEPASEPEPLVQDPAPKRLPTLAGEPKPPNAATPIHNDHFCETNPRTPGRRPAAFRAQHRTCNLPARAILSRSSSKPSPSTPQNTWRPKYDKNAAPSTGFQTAPVPRISPARRRGAEKHVQASRRRYCAAREHLLRRLLSHAAPTESIRRNRDARADSVACHRFSATCCTGAIFFRRTISRFRHCSPWFITQL